MNCRTGIAEKIAVVITAIVAMCIATTALADGQGDGLTDEQKDSQTVSVEQLADEVDGKLDPAAADDQVAVVAHQSKPVYVPPRRGAPKTRVGGGTRSSGSGVQLALLAPEHMGLTGRPAPMLYWWLSKDHEGPFEFVIMRVDGIEPVLRFRQESKLAAGIHRLDLAAADFSLEPGITYRWSVAIVRDEAQRARDVVALATLKYVVDGSVPNENQDEAEALAAAGLWYDALALASVAIDPSARADLLDQVGLDQVAQWSRDAD